MMNSLAKGGVNVIADLINEDDDIIIYEEFMKRYNVKCTILQYYKLMQYPKNGCHH